MTVEWGSGSGGGPFRVSHTWAISGPLLAAAGAVDFIPGIFVPVLGTAEIVEVSFVQRGMGTVHIDLLINGSVFAGSFDATSTAVIGDVTGLPLSLADNDYVSIVINSVSSGPADGLSFSAILELTP